MGILHIRDHGLIVLALLLGDNAKQACIWDGDALEVAMLAYKLC
jgi:hypothetical protein